MVEKDQTELSIGLSNEEKKDLEELIRAFKKGRSTFPEGKVAEKVQGKTKFTEELLAKQSEILMRLDSEMKSFYEIIRLSYEKSAIMNSRINAIMASIKDRKNL